MDFYQIESFLKIAELQNINQAAKELNITQPALSHRIASLEKELGISLFDRVGKSVVLNNYGQTLLPYAKQVIDEMLLFQKHAEMLAKTSSHNVVLQICSASSAIMDAINQFQTSSTFQIIPQYYNTTDSGVADLCIDSSLRPAEDPFSLTLLKEELKLAFPSNHPLYHAEGVRLSTLSEIPFLCGTSANPLRSDTIYFCKKAGFSPKISVEIDNPSHRLRMVQLGQGLTFVPARTTIPEDISKIQLTSVVDIDCSRFLNIHFLKQNHTSKEARIFCHYLESYFKS